MRALRATIHDNRESIRGSRCAPRYSFGKLQIRGIVTPFDNRRQCPNHLVNGHPVTAPLSRPVICGGIMSMIIAVLQLLRIMKREKIVDRREATKILADELDKLADLMSNVLAVTSPTGLIRQENLPELDVARKQVWNRWTTILETRGYASQHPETLKEIEKCISIAHAAPGAFVEEVYLVQESLSKGSVTQVTRNRFLQSINGIRDLTTRMRLGC